VTIPSFSDIPKAFLNAVDSFTGKPVSSFCNELEFSLFLFCPSLLNCICLNSVSLDEKEEQKLDKIRSIISEVGENLGFTQKDLPSVGIDYFGGCCATASRYVIGKPVIFIGGNSFNKFEELDLERDLSALKFDFSSLPDDPIEIAKKLDGFSILEQRKVRAAADIFSYIHDEDEFKFIVAHELGHIKHSHALSDIFYSSMFSLAYTVILKEASKRFNFSLSSSLVIASPLGYLYSQYLSKEQEKEADNECKGTYEKGLKSFLKKRLVVEVMQGNFGNYESVVKKMLVSWDLFSTHPNHAKRLQFFTQKDYTPLKKMDVSFFAEILSVVSCSFQLYTLYSALEDLFPSKTVSHRTSLF
jgi:hypothetical protein